MELMVQSGPDAGKIFSVGPTSMVAGRQIGTEITLNDGQASRRHASFTVVNGSLVVSDLGSANGTTVNGQRLVQNQSRPVNVGDIIGIGSTSLLVQPGANSGYSPSSPFPTDRTEVVPGSFNSNLNSNPNPGPFAQPQPTYNNNPNQGYALPSYGTGSNQVSPNVYSAPPAVPVGQNYDYNVPSQVAPAPVPAYNPNQYGGSGQYGGPGQGYASPVASPPPPAPKKGGSLLIGGLIGIVVLAAAAIGAIVVLGGQKDNSTPIPAVFNPPTAAPGTAPATTAPAVPTPTKATGQIGQNPPPPAPPVTTAAAPTAQPTTAAAAQAGGTVQGLGLRVTFPKEWKTFVDESKNVIEGDAPDAITYGQIRRISGVKGSAAERLTDYLEGIGQDIGDFKIIREVKISSTNPNAADAYITYTDSQDNVLHRDYVICAATGTDDTYFVRFSTDDTKFDYQVSTFNAILNSVQSQ